MISLRNYVSILPKDCNDFPVKSISAGVYR